MHREELHVETTGDTDLVDLTLDVARCVSASGIREGQALVFTPGSTAAVTTIEYEDGALADFRRLLEELAPRDGDYEHNRRWGDGNGYSHLRSAARRAVVHRPGGGRRARPRHVAAGDPVRFRQSAAPSAGGDPGDRGVARPRPGRTRPDQRQGLDDKDQNKILKGFPPRKRGNLRKYHQVQNAEDSDGTARHQVQNAEDSDGTVRHQVPKC